MKFLIIFLILILGCSKESTNLNNGTKIKFDGLQSFFYIDNQLNYIDNKGYGAQKIKFYYKNDKISTIELIYWNQIFNKLNFEYNENKLVKIIDSAFEQYTNNLYYSKITEYNFINTNSIGVLQTTISDKNGYKRLPRNYTLYLKNQNIYKIQENNTIDSFDFDDKINPRYSIKGFSSIFDYSFMEEAGMSWIKNNNKNNIIKHYSRNIQVGGNYKIETLYNEYDKELKLLNVNNSENGNGYQYLNYSYY